MSAAEPDNKKLKMSSPENPRIIALFDVDGTLTIPRGEVTPDMMNFMKELSKKITVGIVGGSDLPKQEEQLGEGIVKVFPYNFSQNGLVVRACCSRVFVRLDYCTGSSLVAESFPGWIGLALNLHAY